MFDGWRLNLIGYVVALVGVAVATTFYRLVLTNANATTVALSLLLVVLATASRYGIGPSILASTAGVLCFNFFFLPPVGTLTIQDPQNWVALFAFLITAVIASQLSAAARAQASDAERRREEVTKLYQLSRAIIATPDSETALSSIARQVVEVFNSPYCAVFVASDGKGWQRLAIAGETECDPSYPDIEEAFRSGDLRSGPGPVTKGGPFKQNRDATYAPLKVGVRSIGVVVLESSHLERGTVEAIAGLVALALERARFLEEVSRTEALRQSDELKTAILASVSHDLRTPLTSIRAAVDSLLLKDVDWDKAALHEFHSIISEEVERLTRLVHNLLEMARIEAGEIKIVTEWESMPELIDDVIDRCSVAVRNHRVNVNVREHTPLVKIDARLVSQVLANLLENAAKYSPDRREISVSAYVEGGDLKIIVKDQGPGVPKSEADRVFDKFYRSSRHYGEPSDGTGMGLAIAKGIAEAHGGRIWVESQPTGGASFGFSIPVECAEPALLETRDEL